MAQFVLVNVVVAVLMKHLEESNKEAKEEAEMDTDTELDKEAQNITDDSSGGPGDHETYVGTMPDSPGQVSRNSRIIILDASTWTVLNMLLRNTWFSLLEEQKQQTVLDTGQSLTPLV